MVLGFSAFYLAGFVLLEKRYVPSVHIMTLPIDYQIPFLEIFVIPYLLWFVYVGGAVAYFLLHTDEDFDRFALFLAFGMTLFLVISAVYPNGLDLRPMRFERTNIFTQLVRLIWVHDTPTNVLPSIHVYNSVAVCLAVKRSHLAQKNRNWFYGSVILSILIILSTVFLKQHSVFDVACGLALAAVADHMYYGVRVPVRRRRVNRQWT